MQTILEYIMMNYTSFLLGSIIILLAIIGYYADKTNFGQGKTKENEENPNINSLEGKRLDDILEHDEETSDGINETSQTQKINNKAPVDNLPINNNIVSGVPLDSNLQTQNIQTINSPNTNIEIAALNNSEANFEKFDKEFNELLPKKEIIDDELLDEIDSLSLDKTQKINISDIPDLDDVDLPQIKSLPIEEEDIWKF